MGTGDKNMHTGLIVLLGGLTWSFAEYGLHHWVGHLGKGKTAFSREHLTHHARKDYFAPAWQKALWAAPILTGMASALGLLTTWQTGFLFTTGFALAYAAYEWFHRHLHIAPPHNRFGHWARKHHFAHHFNNPHYNHGVTSPIWDWAFGTYKKTDRVQVPYQKAMNWLVDRQGHLKPEFAADYQLIGKQCSRQ